jgi:NAD-dependent DNA ligase
LNIDEADLLKAFFADFIPKEETTIDVNELKKLKEEMHISGICSRDPQIEFSNRVFCFTGASEKAKREDIEKIVISKGAKFSNNVVKNLDYLVVGNAGNPCWAFSCYGRKVEQAIGMRKEGCKIMLINENEFWKVV